MQCSVCECTLFLDPNCFAPLSKKTKLLTAFYFPGFWHEQSRADRDGYVTIHKGNIMRGMEYNFMKYSLAKINHLGAKYDTCSVMHYGAYAFSRVRHILE